MDSSGSAMKENEAYINSLQGHLSKLNSAWQSLARDTINSDFVKSLLDTATGFLKLTDALGGLQAYIPILTSFFAMTKSKDIIKAYGEISTSIEKVERRLQFLKQYSKETGQSMVSVLSQTASAATKLNIAMLGIGVGITAAIAIWNRYKQKQEEIQANALQTLQDTDGVIKAKQDEINKTQDEITQLEKEKQAYIENTQAKGENLDETILKSKDKEIEKRKNIYR